MHQYPRFLYCQNEQVTADEYILHTQHPRFLARMVHRKEGNNFDIVWVDPPPLALDAYYQLTEDLTSWYLDYLSKPAGFFLLAGNN